MFIETNIKSDLSEHNFGCLECLVARAISTHSYIPFGRAVVISATVTQRDVFSHLGRLFLHFTCQSRLHKITCCGDNQQRTLTCVYGVELDQRATHTKCVSIALC
jgi:hypothetical protein